MTHPPRFVTRNVFRIFTKTHGLHVQSDASRYLEELLKNDDNLLDTLDKMVKTYKKRNADNGDSVIVTKQALQDIVVTMQTSAATAALVTPFSRTDDDSQQSVEDVTMHEPIHVAQHFHVVDAFNMPRWAYSVSKKGFAINPEKPSLTGNPRSNGNMYRDRFHIARQRLLRNDTFCQTAMQVLGGSHMKLTPIKALLGQEEGHFLLFGMLVQLDEGKVYLEDEDASIELDLSQCTYDVGYFTVNSFVVVEGIYKDDHIFYAEEMSFPPAERRDLTDTLFARIDFTGLPKPLVEEHLLKQEEVAHGDIFFVILSDVWLDQPRVLSSLRRLFEGYVSTQIPLAFILIGNFQSSPSVSAGTQSSQYKENFDTLADLIGEFPDLATHSYFVFVPGALDPWGKSCLPRPRIPEYFTARIKQKARRAVFTTNPCRIRYCTQDILIFREDLQSRLARNALVKAKEQMAEDSVPSHIRHLVRTVIDQGHVCPLPMSIQPIYWDYDHALRLYPLPHTMILADQCENYSLNYQGTHVLNPGSYPNSDFSWTIYFPATRESEQRVLPAATA